MSIATITRFQKERDEQVSFIDQLLDKVEAEGRDLVDAEKANLRAAQERVEALDEQLKPLIDFQKRAGAAEAFEGRVGGRQESAPARRSAMDEEHFGPVNLGRAFVDSDAFAAYRAAPRGSSGRAAVELSPAEFRATILTTDTQGGRYLPKSGRTWQDVASGTPMPLLNLLTPEPTEVTSGEVVVIGESSGHATVAEGADKPEIDWTETVVPWSLDTIAGWKKFSRQQLDDAAGFETLINSKLLQSWRKNLHAAAVTALTGSFSGANSTTGASGVKLHTLIRRAIATLQKRDVYPNLVALNPDDHADIDLDMLSLTLNGPVVNPDYWNLQVISLAALPAGTAIIGDITEAITWKQKGGVDIFVTDSDISGAGNTATSDFRQNKLTALAESRSKFIVTDASSLQRVVKTA